MWLAEGNGKKSNGQLLISTNSFPNAWGWQATHNPFYLEARDIETNNNL